MAVSIFGDGADVFVVVDGVRIAKRGRPGTSQAKTWVSIEPGWTVLDERSSDDWAIEIEHKGVRTH